MSKFFDTGFEIITLSNAKLTVPGTNNIYAPDIQDVQVISRHTLKRESDTNGYYVCHVKLTLRSASGATDVRDLYLQPDSSGYCPRLQKFLDIVNSMRD